MREPSRVAATSLLGSCSCGGQVAGAVPTEGFIFAQPKRDQLRPVAPEVVEKVTRGCVGPGIQRRFRGREEAHGLRAVYQVTAKCGDPR